MVGPGKIFKIDVLRRLENAISNLVIAKNMAMLLILQVEFAESVLDIPLYPESTIDSPWLNLEKTFRHEGTQMAGKCYFKIGFCKYSKCFL